MTPVGSIDAGNGVASPSPPRDLEPDAEPVLADLLVEEISIDGMCGVY
jgi:mycofactocin precursor